MISYKERVITMWLNGLMTDDSVIKEINYYQENIKCVVGLKNV